MARRDWSVYPVWFAGAEKAEYAKVRAVGGSLAVGRFVEVQRTGEGIWRSGHVAEAPADRAGQGGGTIWIELVLPVGR